MDLPFFAKKSSKQSNVVAFSRKRSWRRSQTSRIPARQVHRRAVLEQAKPIEIRSKLLLQRMLLFPLKVLGVLVLAVVTLVSGITQGLLRMAYGVVFGIAFLLGLITGLIGLLAGNHVPAGYWSGVLNAEGILLLMVLIGITLDALLWVVPIVAGFIIAAFREHQEN